MADDLHTQIKISANADGVETGVTRAKRSLSSLGQSAEQVGEQAARGLGKLGGSGEAVTQGMDRVTRNIEAGMRRQIAAWEAGGTANRQYQEGLARMRGADMAALKPTLDAYEAAKNRAEAAARAQGTLIDRLGAVGPVASIAAGQIAALASSFTLGAVVAFVKNVNDGVDALNDIKDATGATIESISALEDVARRSGASLDLVGSVLVKFNDLLSKATPESNTARQLKAIGLSVAELRKLDPAEAVRVTAVALSGYADDMNKGRLMTDLFGKSVKELAPFMANVAEQGALVGKVTAQQAEEAEKLNKALFGLQANASDLSREFARRMVPGLTQIAGAMAAGAKEGGVLLGVLRGLKEFGAMALGVDPLGQATSRAERAQAEIKRLQGMLQGPELIQARDPANDTNNRRIAQLRAQIVTVQKEALAATDALKAMVGVNASGAGESKDSVGDLSDKGDAQAAAKDAVEARLAEIRRGLAVEASLTKATLDEIGSMRRMQALSDREAIDVVAAAEVGQLERQRAALQAELAIQSQQKNALKEVSNLKGQIDLVDTEISERRKKQLREINELTFRQAAAASAVITAQKQQDGEDWDAYNRQRQDAWNAALTASYEYGRNIDEANEAVQFELGLMGQGERARAIAIAQYQVQVRLKERLREIEGRRLDAEQEQALRAIEEATAARQMANVEQQVMRDEWNKTTEEVNRSLTDALLRGFEEGKTAAENLRDTTVNMFKTMVLRPTISAILQPVSGAVSSAIGDGTASGGGVLGMIKDAKSLYDWGSKAYSWFTGASSASGVTSSLGAAFYTAPALYAGASAIGGASAALAGGTLGSGTFLGTAGVLGSSGGALGTGTALLGEAATSYAISAGTAAGATAGAAAGTAAAAGGGTSAAGAAASLGPYGWIAAAAILAIMAFAGKGEERYGGHYGINFQGDQVLDYRRGGYIDSKQGEVTFVVGPGGGEFAKDYVSELMTGTTKGINALLGDLGSSLALTSFQAGLETSGKGRGGVFSGGTLTGGVTFGESGLGSGRPWESTSSRSPNAEEAVKNFATDMLQVTVQALQAATDLPKVITAQLKGIDAEKLTDEAAAELLNSIQAQIDFVRSFRDAINQLPFQNLRNLSFDAATGLIAAAGGLEALNQNLTGYFENYFTAEEQRAAAIRRTQDAFEGLGLVMPDVAGNAADARAAFRALAQSIDVGTEKGQQQYAGLIALQGAFADLTPIIDNTAEAARAAQASLQQRQQLEMQLLQLQGDTGEIRRRQMAELLTDENRAIQQAIFDLQDKQAADATAKAAQDAADRVKAAWQSVGDTLVDEVKRIRGEIAGAGLGGFAYTQGQFALATAQARAGDQAAAASLPELSRSVVELARQNASSAADFKAFQAQIAASLLETTRAIAAGQGITVPAFANGGAHAGGWAMVGERGPELAYLPPAQVFTAGASAGALGDFAAMLAEMRAQREDERSRAATQVSLQLRATRAAEATQRLWEDVTEGGSAMRAREVQS
ncbi:hypothetical protein [Pseudorhodoferax sp. Leaf274]|uniref:hypothetical protein n=1 Tax=Pseudorhodoferax sp. Leaf274 TaxID=1736318 RepID=UPI000702ABE3|nr:hypothetical protein [Pseudorhodoferax sp. Leaf274]KQP39680.1 hypothetical protein ASF44_08080 [Pseudorhodoferax sp. Leaf274]